MLEVEAVSVSYAGIPALRRVSIEVRAGECVAVLGHNGAGKTTLLRTVTGLISPESGVVRFQGEPIARLAPEKVAKLGVSLVPEQRRVFPQMTVEENLQLGGSGLGRESRRERLHELMDRFPVLRELRSRSAGGLSGGEQQQLAIARALVRSPKLLLLDEPSLGLAPIVVHTVFELLRELRDRDGTSLLLVEQNIGEALALADRVYVLSSGVVTVEGPTDVVGPAENLRGELLGL